ncbi:hypothetical protein L195_g055670, partial [Trifolium pratense]
MRSAMNGKTATEGSNSKTGTPVRIRNCGRSIADAVASATASHRNCGVILINVYDHFITATEAALDVFGD